LICHLTDVCARIRVDPAIESWTEINNTYQLSKADFIVTSLTTFGIVSTGQIGTAMDDWSES